MYNKLTTYLFCFLFIGFLSCKFTSIDTSSQLIALINSLDCGYPSATGTGHLPISENIAIDGTLNITSEDLSVPECCSNIDYCSEKISIENLYDHTGIELTEPSHDQTEPVNLTLKNVVVRFRKVIINLGGPPPPPGDYMRNTLIQILPPTWTACEEAQFRCDLDSVCYDSYFEYCRYCDALTQGQCSCRGEEGLYDDGTSCLQVTGDDTLYDGECINGECVDTD